MSTSLSPTKRGFISLSTSRLAEMATTALGSDDPDIVVEKEEEFF